jgi:hypothetical protein
MSSIEEEVVDLDTDVVLKKKTRSGKAATSTQGASELPPVPMRKRKPALRKIKESPYVTEEVEDIEASSRLVTREMKKKKAEDAASLQKALEISQELEISAACIAKEDTGDAALEVVKLLKMCKL